MNRRLIAVAVVLMLVLAIGCASSRGISDSKIEADVRSAISNVVSGSPTSIAVQVQKGVVTLSGHTATEEERRKIADAANDVKGVRTVINNIQVE